MRQRLERPAQQHSKHMLLNALLQKEARGQWKRSRPSSEPTRRAKHFRRSRQCSQEEQKSLWAQDGVSQKVEGTAQQLSENMRLNALQKTPLVSGGGSHFHQSPQKGQNNEGDRCNVTRENRMCCAAKMA